VVSLVELLTEELQQGVTPSDPPWEMLDENRWLAARHGIDAELFDLAADRRLSVRELTETLLQRLTAHARDLGCEEQLLGVEDLLRAGNGAVRQQMVYEANHDLRELMAEIVARTA
jgi:glutamate---cysteine ligase / carboxylate-amine ligase